ncbi:protein CIP2A [Nerophis ophidion]|uniref:protein CIP2A n=1 Tax=Nerophis ophidion TaxID=159077 RepID=UPI002AE07417|nr:protein CIP2A [Nerophis ophidion]
MDVTTCLKSLLLASQQYGGDRSAHNTAQLLKQVEEVSALKCDQLLSSGHLLPMECVCGLVELTGNPNTCPALASAIISLLAQLACDDDSRGMLHSSFNLTNTMASVIHRHSATPGDPLVLQSLQLLQKLTYNTRVFPSTNINELVGFLMTNILSQKGDIILPCLGLMANLCRGNHLVQSHIKSLVTVKPFYRTLINFLAHHSLTVVVFTLSILASLTLNEKVGEKLFDAKNIHQTFQLVFNIIVNGDGTLTRKYSVDLLVDLLGNPKIADYLTRYKHFPACVSKVLGLLQLKDPASAAMVLELLLAMSGVPALRLPLCQVLFKPAAPKLSAAGSRHAESGLALVQWLSSPVKGAEGCSLKALRLLKELLEEALGAAFVWDGVRSFVEMLLPVLLGFVQGDVDLRQHCIRISRVSGVLLIMCAEDAARALVAEQVSAQLCLSQVETLLVGCHSNTPLPPGSDDNLSQVCAEALLKTLELMSKLRQQVKDMETSFYRVLQDHRIATPFSLALTSFHRERVQIALALLLEATPLPDFPSLVLGDNIAAHNSYRQREAELAVKRVAVKDVLPLTLPRVNNSGLEVSSAASSGVHSLVEKLHSGLELQEQTKDAHVSDIIDVYEQQLATKESLVQDLLEAKAAAVSQADHLIAQYHFQRAQAEAEARKMASLLKEAERRREELQTELGAQLEEAKRSKADTEELLQHNARLQHDSEEHQALKGSYNTLLNKFNESERLLKELQASHGSLARQLETLKRNHRELQLQYDRTASLLRESGEKAREVEQERRELEETLDVLRKQLDETEQARKDASIKNGQLEGKLQQREDELKKHSSMIAMIHSLSSGKIKSDVNLSL